MKHKQNVDKLPPFSITNKGTLKILQEMRVRVLRDSRMYQRLAVSEEHWHTPRHGAYRDSSIALKKQGRALWGAINAIKMLNRIQNDERNASQQTLNQGTELM